MKDCTINLAMVIAFVVAGPVLLVWSAWSGRAITQGGMIYRSKQPVGFWITYAVLFALGAVCFWGAVAFLRHGGICPAFGV